MADLKIGMIGLDTSHVVAFAKCFNKPDHAEHIWGARLTVAYPGVGSADFDLSHERLPGFTKQLLEDYSVEMVDSPEAVAKQVDLLFIMSVDGRVHREMFARTVPFKRPTFIDKPFAVSLSDAQEIVRLAKENHVPLMSCSSLRYAHTLTEAIAQHGEGFGAIVGCDVFGPMAIQPTQPGLFWYGIHSVEMVNRIMGRGCVEVKATKNAEHDLITLTFSDGRIASIRGLRKGHSKFGCTIHREKTMQFVNASDVKRSYYSSLLEAIMKSLPHGKSDVETEDTLEIVKIIEACNKSRESGQVERVQ
jgi:predicted dehydrogenase